MVFNAPSYVPRFSFTPPHSIPVHEFLLKDDRRYGRHPIAASKPPFTCGITGRSYTAVEVADRVDFLARALGTRLACPVNEGSELNKVISIFSFNTIDSLTVSWATHRLNGVSNHISATYTVPELVYQLDKVKPLALFTCLPLLSQALEAAAAVGIPKQRVFLLEVPSMGQEVAERPADMSTVDDLIKEGSRLKALPSRKWRPGQGERQTAFLCSSSGTSGLPKNVMLSHRNVIANIMQFAAFESNHKSPVPEYCLGLLPFSHNLALMAVAHLAVYRGDGVIVLPGFDLQDTLQAIQNFKIGRLWLIPPILTTMLRARDIVRGYDLSHVNSAVVGATALSKEVAADFDSLFPGCKLIQGYGLTETTVAVTLTNPADNVFCSCGSLFPGCEGRLVDEDGKDILEHDIAGELYVRSPTVMIGYLNNEAETKNMLSADGWLRTGDLAEFRLSPEGHSHLFFIDRVKELIKVRGMQVSPTELENHLHRHPQVESAVVVPVPDDDAGELPMAFIVKSKTLAGKGLDNEMLRLKLQAYVNSSFAAQKRLAGGIEFVEAIPKTGSGKVQRKVLKGWAKDIAAERRVPVVQVPNVAVFNFDSDDELIDDWDD